MFKQKVIYRIIPFFIIFMIIYEHKLVFRGVYMLLITLLVYMIIIFMKIIIDNTLIYLYGIYFYKYY